MYIKNSENIGTYIKLWTLCDPKTIQIESRKNMCR